MNKRSTSEILTDFGIFLFFGPIILLISQFVDAFYFLIHIYRNDVKEYGHESKGEHILTEE